MLVCPSYRDKALWTKQRQASPWMRVIPPACGPILVAGKRLTCHLNGQRPRAAPEPDQITWTVVAAKSISDRATGVRRVETHPLSQRFRQQNEITMGQADRPRGQRSAGPSLPRPIGGLTSRILVPGVRRKLFDQSVARKSHHAQILPGGSHRLRIPITRQAIHRRCGIS